MWQTYKQPTTVDDTLALLHQNQGRARLVAGGTDVIVELQRGVRPTEMLIDLSALYDLRYIHIEGDELCLGALTTHNDVLRSRDCQQYALPLVQACWEVGAPQIRARATLVGNLVTASPANDTITPLMALDAHLVLASVDGERVVPLRDFYRGVRRTVLQSAEMVREIRVPLLNERQRGLFLKLGLRRAQAISVLNAALVITLDDDVVSQARITLGSVAPTIVHAPTVEAFLPGKRLDADVCRQAGELVRQDASPIDDVRSSASYRLQALSGLIMLGLQRIVSNELTGAWMEQPVALEIPHAADAPRLDSAMPFDDVIMTTINGRVCQFHDIQNKTLLQMLREDAGLTGTKEGCAEGECGACTVWLNGQAVMSCLVPAPQVHGGIVTTIEGLAPAEGQLHPLQQAFIDQGAVQCGFCIPGMLMAGARLFDEYPHPSSEQVQIALSGNICRCTGYRKILDAVQCAGERS